MSFSESYLFVKKYNPKNIPALATFIAPIPAKIIPAKQVSGIVFTNQDHFGKKVFPFATLINNGIATRKTPKLHIKVVTDVSKKNDNITSWASFVPPSFTKYHSIEVQEKCIIAPGIQVNKVPAKTTFALFLETGFSKL